MTILGAVLIDKEIAESTNYVNLSARLRGHSRDARLLRILFESRIKQRIAQSVPMEMVERLKRSEAKKEPAQDKN